jgi:hypothetical protein
VSAFWKLGGSAARGGGRGAQPFSFLFESVEGGESIARYTFLGTGMVSERAGRTAVGRSGRPAFASPFIMKYWLRSSPAASRGVGSESGKIEIWEHGKKSEIAGEFLAVARQKFAQFKPVKVEGLPALSVTWATT